MAVPRIAGFEFLARPHRNRRTTFSPRGAARVRAIRGYVRASPLTRERAGGVSTCGSRRARRVGVRQGLGSRVRSTFPALDVFRRSVSGLDDHRYPNCTLRARREGPVLTVSALPVFAIDASRVCRDGGVWRARGVVRVHL